MKTLVVEDDPVFSDVLATALRRRGFDVTVALDVTIDGDPFFAREWRERIPRILV